MLQEYIQENKTLKNENSQLEKFREKIRKQHEILTRENEKLARKLDQVLRTQGGSGGGGGGGGGQVEFVDGEPQKTMSKSKQQQAALPVIEKRTKYGTPVEAVSVRSTSPVIVRRGQAAANGSGGKKLHTSQSGSNLSDPGEASASLE
jgi:hypothetical protein